MRMNKKKIAVISLILCVLAIISLGSLAWFTDSDTVDNTLKFVTDFEMDLYETNNKGKPVWNDNKTETIGQTYENLTPGTVLHKDPTVVNKSTTEAQYIRVSVTVDKASKWVANSVSSGTDLTTIFNGFDSSKWTRYDEPVTDGNADTITYVFYLNGTLAPGKKATLFTGVTIPSNITAEGAEAIGESHIIVKAEAIQSTGLGTVANAKAAFDVVEGNNLMK